VVGRVLFFSLLPEVDFRSLGVHLTIACAQRLSRQFSKKKEKEGDDDKNDNEDQDRYFAAVVDIGIVIALNVFRDEGEDFL